MVSEIFDCHFGDKYFYITNDLHLRDGVDKSEKKYVIYGHCFTDDDILKDQQITESQFSYIRENHEELSGLFVCFAFVQGEVEIIVDPLVQYPVFYCQKGNGAFSISNSLSMLAKNYYEGPSISYLFDSLVYRAPLRGLTPLKSIKMIQFDDLQKGSSFRADQQGMKIKKTDLLFKKRCSYDEALSRFAETIQNRASIIAKKFKYIECQLSGGLDCRMVASAFLGYSNVYYYSFGVDSQDRLCFESLSDKFDLKKTYKIKFYGAGRHNAAYRFKMLDDLNGMKLHTYGGYLNSEKSIDPDGCRLTGYFGEYVGHKLPSANISSKDGSIIKDPHIDRLPSSAYKVGDEYSIPFWKYNSQTERCGKSKRAINQLFYLNNRGPSHFGMNSVADNRHDNSFNVLYDPIAITVSELSPYADYENKEGATCIDLICKIAGPEFALFPYENRKIPYYRKFDYLPELNCFGKHTFENRNLEAVRKEKQPLPNLSSWNLVGKMDLTDSADILNEDLFDRFFEEYPELYHLRGACEGRPFKIHQEILCNFLLADVFYERMGNGSSST